MQAEIERKLQLENDALGKVKAVKKTTVQIF